MTTEVLPEGTRALPVAAAQRNTYLHSLLPDFDEHEFPTDNELINVEMIVLEIQANAEIMQALLKQLPDTK
jgi:hypothetical protein